MKKLISLILILILMTSCVVMVGCDGGGDDDGATAEATSEDTSAPTSEDTEEPTFEETSKPTGGGGGFTWDDMPVYPGAEEDKDALNMGGASDEGRMEWRNYKTSDSYDEVVEFYQSEMPEYNWNQAAWMDLEPTNESWSMERGVYEKNDWSDDAMVEITDKADGVVYIMLMRANDQEVGSSDATSDETPSTSSSEGGFTWDDMPIYPGAETEEMAWVSLDLGDGMKSESRIYTTSDSLDDVVDFYKSEMPKNGWGDTMFIHVGDMASGMFAKNGGQDIGQVIISVGGDVVDISLQRMYEPK